MMRTSLKSTSLRWRHCCLKSYMSLAMETNLLIPTKWSHNSIKSEFLSSSWLWVLSAWESPHLLPNWEKGLTCQTLCRQVWSRRLWTVWFSMARITRRTLMRYRVTKISSVSTEKHVGGSEKAAISTFRSALLMGNHSS
jgi:hypothetical protein